ncbi:MAG: hypothetical protein J2P17_08690 [Mycobacterium sp.]|nr:hypothetical protein [Mycobacterium sp.]
MSIQDEFDGYAWCGWQDVGNGPSPIPWDGPVTVSIAIAAHMLGVTPATMRKIVDRKGLNRITPAERAPKRRGANAPELDAYEVLALRNPKTGRPQKPDDELPVIRVREHEHDMSRKDGDGVCRGSCGYTPVTDEELRALYRIHKLARDTAPYDAGPPRPDERRVVSKFGPCREHSGSVLGKAPGGTAGTFTETDTLASTGKRNRGAYDEHAKPTAWDGDVICDTFGEFSKAVGGS